MDVSTLDTAVESLRAELDTILEAKMSKCEAYFAEPAEDTFFASLFSTVAVPPLPPREHAKMRRGRHENEARAQKREHYDLEVVRRTSIVDEEAR